MVCSSRLVALFLSGLSLFLLQGCHMLSCRSNKTNRNETSAARSNRKGQLKKYGIRACTVHSTTITSRNVPAMSSYVAMAMGAMYLSWGCVTSSRGCYVIVMTRCHNASLAGRWYISRCLHFYSFKSCGCFYAI